MFFFNGGCIRRRRSGRANAKAGSTTTGWMAPGESGSEKPWIGLIHRSNLEFTLPTLPLDNLGFISWGIGRGKACRKLSLHL